VVGVSGGIAAYKVTQVARDLTRLGAEVDVILTRGAEHFVRPLSFEALTGRPVLTELFSVEGAAAHIRLGKEADAVCVAPATADLIARAAQGRADDLLTTTLLVAEGPVLICPAMNDAMYAHPQTRSNVAHLRDKLGYVVVGPAEGPLAHGEGEGAGRMVEPHEIVEHIGRALGADPRFEGRKVVVTAGPTREAVDAVRFLGNRSSGKMGYAIASAAWRRGAQVHVVSGPVGLPEPVGAQVTRVETAEEMREATQNALRDADLVVFAAAVADFRPVDPASRKLKKEEGAPTIVTAANPDVALETRSIRPPRCLAVGFALETDDLLARARRKMAEKGFDFVVANPAAEAGAGFEADTNRALFLWSDGRVDELPLQAKTTLAEEILDRVAPRMTTSE
jgi:phosphopantothenoylcysteine decarboxylase/phosphopantothenate--cysteine ligase